MPIDENDIELIAARVRQHFFRMGATGMARAS
jgi:hypothetical protein